MACSAHAAAAAPQFKRQCNGAIDSERRRETGGMKFSVDGEGEARQVGKSFAVIAWSASPLELPRRGCASRKACASI